MVLLIGLFLIEVVNLNNYIAIGIVLIGGRRIGFGEILGLLGFDLSLLGLRRELFFVIVRCSLAELRLAGLDLRLGLDLSLLT